MGFLGRMFNAFSKASKITSLKAKYQNDPMNSNAPHEIYLYLTEDKLLGFVMNKHHATYDDIEYLWYLLVGGMCFEERGHFYPVSALLYAESLDYLLSHKNDNIYETSGFLLDFFDRI